MRKVVQVNIGNNKFGFDQMDIHQSCSGHMLLKDKMHIVI